MTFPIKTRILFKVERVIFMQIQLSDHFTTKKLIRFTLPSIAMMVFTSIYGVVDGFFVSNFAGKIPFAAANFILPFLMMLSAIGFMFGTGGSALVAKMMGEGEKEKANRTFSMLIFTAFGIGVLTAVLGFIFLRPLAAQLGASGELLDNCVLYGRFLLVSLPFFILQLAFQSFYVAAEKPQLGLRVSIIAGVTNMVLDALFVAVFRWGLMGAAAATMISEITSGTVSLVYFIRPNDSLLRITKPQFDGRALLKTCTNGCSELLSNISMSLVGMLYNVQLMKYAGENGVAAYGVLMYVNFTFISIFIGFTVGTAPLISFNLGAQNHAELRNLLKKSLLIIGTVALAMLGLGQVLAKPLSTVFVGYDPSLLSLTIRGFSIFSFSFLFAGFAIFGSAFFTALNNGLVSAIVSFLRTLVFQLAAVCLLPLWLDIDGIWLSVVVAELAAASLALIFIKALQNRYHY